MGYILVFIGFTSVLLSFLLFFQNKSKYNLRSDFALLMLLAGLWATFIGLFYVSRGSLVFIAINYIVALGMVYCLAGFSLRLDKRKAKYVAILHILGLILGLILVVAYFVNSEWIVYSVKFYNSTNILVHTNTLGYMLYAVAFVAAYVTSVTYIINAISRSLKSERSKYVQILSSILIVGFAGLYFNLYLPISDTYSYIWVAPSLVALVVLTTGVSIAKYKTFDLKATAVRSTAYLLSLAVLAFIYYGIAYFTSMTIFQGKINTGFSIGPLNIVLALILAFVFQPIKTFFDKITDRFFYRDRYKPDDFYARLSEVLTTTTDLRSLLQRAAGEIGSTLKAEQAFFFVHAKKHRMTAGTKNHKDVPLKDVDDLNEYVKANGTGTIAVQALDTHHHIRRILLSHNISLLLPLVRREMIIGYLALGEQKSSGYTTRDIKVLNTISDELIIAIQNALSVQEVREVNAHLEQRIEAATAELRTSNARLKRLDASKDEFLSMASHQLRTPLTSVKGYLSMMIDGDVGNISPVQKQVLTEAFSSSERMVHLIHDFLNVSRLQTGKFMLELGEVDLVQLVKEEIKSLEKVASSHSMNLKFVNHASKTLMMQLDDTKIRQVVMNYIDNAIFYSHPDTTITIELEMSNNEVTLKVNDTGIGVPKSEQEHLFGKFYRASNARKQRPDGTGVGIYLAKKVISALGGDIVFSSLEGKGSTFGFKLPLIIKTNEPSEPSVDAEPTKRPRAAKKSAESVQLTVQ